MKSNTDEVTELLLSYFVLSRGINPTANDREFVADALAQARERAIATARDQEAKLWFETWYGHFIAPEKSEAREFARFATERVQETGYHRDISLTDPSPNKE